MQNKPFYRQILLVITVLVLAALACNLPSRQNTAAPTAVPFSEEEAQAFEDNLQATLSSQAPGSEVTITIEEAQLSSYLANRLASDPDQVVRNPRVRLTNGRMEVDVEVNQGVTLIAKAVIVPSVDSSGQPRMQVESINLGSLPVPESLISQMQKMVDGMLVSYLDSTGNSFTITKIEITEGKMVVSGIPQ